MQITIITVPHEQQRYPTCGDWQWRAEDDLIIRVSEMGDWRYAALVGLHEAIEAVLCQHRGISEDAVTAFDLANQARIESDTIPPVNDLDGYAEPGDDPIAPYHREHFFATTVERLMAAELGVDWAAYEKAVEAL